MKTHITFVLDETGSMQRLKDEVITGFNKYVDDVKANKGDEKISFSLMLFDSAHMTWRYKAKNIAKVEPLTPETYRPGASTPLFDAIGKAIAEADEAKADGHLVVVYTDGHENASREFSLQQIKDLIKAKEKKDWNFIFLGASPDAWDAGAAIFAGTQSMSNVIQSKGRRGTTATMQVAYHSTMTYIEDKRAGGIVTDADKLQVEKESEED